MKTRKALAVMLSLCMIFTMLQGVNFQTFALPASNHNHPICGRECCDHDLDGSLDGHEDVEWQEWDGSDMDPNNGGRQLITGAYYLTTDLNFDLNLNIVGDVKLCLNNYDISLSSTAIINVNSGNTLTICDCKEDDHTSGVISGGDIIYVTGGTLNIYSGAISSTAYTAVSGNTTCNFNIYGGSFTSSGGGYLFANSGTANIYGGIFAHTGTGTGFFSDSNAIANVSGGTFAANSNNGFSNSGRAYITGGTFTSASGYGFYGAGDSYISGGTFTSENGYGIGNRETIHISGGKIESINFISEEKPSISGGVFANDYSSCLVTGSEWIENTDPQTCEDYPYAVLPPISTHTHSVCGDDDCTSHGDDITYIEWTSTTTLPTSGNYYLSDDVTLSSAHTVSGDLNLCLGGNTITVDAGIEVGSNVNVKLCSCVDGGKIIRDTSYSNELIELKSGSSLQVAEVTIDGNNSGNNSLVVVNQGTLSLNHGAVLEKNRISSASGCGSAITVTQGTVNINSGAIIQNNSAYSDGGSTIKTYYGATVNMTGGEIKNNTGSKHGGAIQLYGSTAISAYNYQTTTFNMSGGTISGNSCSGVGGGVAVSNHAEFNMSGGAITGNSCGSTGKGGGVAYAEGSSNVVAMNVSGGTITNNTKNGATNNLEVNANHMVNITGALSGQNKIGVSGDSGSSYPLTFTATNNADYSSYFFADNPSVYSAISTGSGSNYAVQLVAAPSVYTATVNLTKDGSAWANSGKTVKLYQDGTEKYTLTESNGAYKNENVLEGTYDVYIDGADTGLDVSSSTAVTAEFFTVTYNKGTKDDITGTVPEQAVVLKGKTYTVPTYSYNAQKPLSLAGYNQLGWRTLSEWFSGGIGNCKTSIEVTSATTLYPVWETTFLSVIYSQAYGTTQTHDSFYGASFLFDEGKNLKLCIKLPDTAIANGVYIQDVTWRVESSTGQEITDNIETEDTSTTLTIPNITAGDYKYHLNFQYRGRYGGGGSYNTSFSGKISIPLSGTVTLDKLNPIAGQTINATYSKENETVSYKWYRGSTLIYGETDSSYTTVAADVGKTIKVVVTGTGNYTGTKEATTGTVSTITVTYDANGHGTAPAPKTGLSYNDTLTQPTSPTETGYTFGGWYKEAACTNAWNFATDKVTQNTTLYAKWTINQYTYTFYGDNGTTEHKKATVNYGEQIIPPTNPSKAQTEEKSYYFDGWYTAISGGEKVTSFGTISQDTNFYARYTSKTRVARPTASLIEHIYDGTVQTYVPEGFDEDLMNISNNTQTNVNGSGQTVTVTLKDYSNYEWKTDKETDPTYQFIVQQSGTTYTYKKAFKGGEEEDTFTYGDSITVKVKPEATGTPALATFSLRSAPTVNQMALYYNNGTGDVQISDAVSADGEGYYTMTVDTTENLIIPTNANISLIAKYVGNNNMAGYSDTIILTFNKANAEFTAPTEKTGLIYDGTEQSLINAGSTTHGTIKYSLTNNGSDWSTDIPKVKNAGTHTVYYKVFGDSFHNDTAVQSFDVTISKKALTVAADNKSITYGDAVPTYTATYTGFATGDDESDLTGTLVFDCDYTALSNVNTYTIVASGYDEVNYDITYNNGTLTVSQKEIGITWTNTEFTYDGSAHIPTATATGNVNGDVITLTVMGEQTNAGIHNATVTEIAGEKAGNYILPSDVDESFEIHKKTVTDLELEIIAPIPKKVPQVTLEDNGEYTASISWNPAITDNFEYSTEYTATVTIIPNANYTVDGVLADSFTVDGAQTVNNAANDDEVIVTYRRTFSRVSFDNETTRYTIKFNTNGGTTVANKVVEKNGRVAEPKAPEKDGFTFMGWYSDDELTESYNFASLVKEDITLYAKWEKIDDETDTPDENWENQFADVKADDWYYDDVRYVVENGLFNGVTATSFAPNGIITRAMMVTVLYRLEGEPTVSGITSFADLEKGQYYLDAVCWGQLNGIVKGITQTTFEPDSNITREQIAAIMHRYAKYKKYDVSVGENTNILSYDDFNNIFEYAIPSVQYVVGSGLMKGKTESTINPKENATRAEIATILKRFIEGNK